MFLSKLFKRNSPVPPRPQDPLERLDTGHPSRLPALDELVTKLKVDGVRALCAEIETREQSRAISQGSSVVEPALLLYLEEFSVSERRALEHDGNWSNVWSHTQQTREHWKSICESHNLAEYYSEHMFVFVHEAKSARLVRLVYGAKAKVEAALRREAIQPKYVFASSEPSLNIFFETSKELKDAQTNGGLGLRRGRIWDILKGHTDSAVSNETRSRSDSWTPKRTQGISTVSPEKTNVVVQSGASIHKGTTKSTTRRNGWIVRVTPTQ